MAVPKHQHASPPTLRLISDERVKALIERVLDSGLLEQDDEAAQALAGLIGAVANEENSNTRKALALEIAAAIFARTGAFYTAVKNAISGTHAQYLIPDSRRRTRGSKRHLSQAV